MEASQSQPCGDVKNAPTQAEPSVPMKPSDVLNLASAFLAVPGAWCQQAACIGATHASHPEAVSWCIAGATIRADEHGGAAFAAQNYVSRTVGRNFMAWNDDPNRTQAEVVKALRDAAELAKAEGQ